MKTEPQTNTKKLNKHEKLNKTKKNIGKLKTETKETIKLVRKTEKSQNKQEFFFKPRRVMKKQE